MSISGFPTLPLQALDRLRNRNVRLSFKSTRAAASRDHLECGIGDRVTPPGETEVLRFAIAPEDSSGCDYANGAEMCLNEYKLYPSGHFTASYAISE